MPLRARRDVSALGSRRKGCLILRRGRTNVIPTQREVLRAVHVEVGEPAVRCVDKPLGAAVIAQSVGDAYCSGKYSAKYMFMMLLIKPSSGMPLYPTSRWFIAMM